MLIVDSHCHLNFPDFAEDREAVIARAREAGVGVMQTICTHMGEAEEVRAIAEAHENIWCSVGVHPNHVAESPLVEEAELEVQTRFGKVIGIGETGLDYHYEHSPRALQQESFRRHLRVAGRAGLPVIVHTRAADEDTVQLVDEALKEQPSLTGLIHCFSTSRMLAEEMIARGFYISLSGILTFKKAQELQEIAADLPLERLLVETDAPYLAPVPYRGKRNEPAHTRHTLAFLAALKGVSEEEAARTTTANFFRLFTRAVAPEAG